MNTITELVRHSGNHVVVEAVPGAGKTHMIVDLAGRNVGSLILAYNNALAEEIKSLINPDQTMCYTFHSLCSRYIRVVRDDHQLRMAVEEVEEGTLQVEIAIHATTVLIDEAQDVRPIYIRLLGALGLLKNAERIYVFGDRNQLIYDYDENFPACLDVLTQPNIHVLRGVAWNRVVASVSRRLLPPVATLVSDIFGVSIASRGECDAPLPLVEVRVPKSMFRLSEELQDLKHVPHLLLVDCRSNNRPLHALLNNWSRGGVVMDVHRTTDHHNGATMTCATYWSAKGLQHDTVVVIVPEQTPRNPLYVALTRVLRRLIIVIDPKAPHVAVCQAVMRHQDIVHVTSPQAKRVIASTQGCDPEVSLSGRKEFATKTPTEVPAHRVGTARVSRTVSLDRDDTHLSSNVIVDMALTWTEIRTTGACRRVEEIFQPLFLERNAALELRRHGYLGRAVPPRMTEDMLLARDLRVLLDKAYVSVRQACTLDKACIANLYHLACIKQSYYGFECIARQRDSEPIVTPFDRDRIEWVQCILSEATEFDIPSGDSPSRRLHARSERCSYHVVSQQTSDDVKQAAFRCDAKRSCVLVDLESWTSTTISCDETVE
jgi:hypothetical protein